MITSFFFRQIDDNEDVEKIHDEITTLAPPEPASTEAAENTTEADADLTEKTTVAAAADEETTTAAPDDEEEDIAAATTTMTSTAAVEVAETPRSKMPRILNNPEKTYLGDFTTKWHGVQEPNTLKHILLIIGYELEIFKAD